MKTVTYACDRCGRGAVELGLTLTQKLDAIHICTDCWPFVEAFIKGYK